MNVCSAAASGTIPREEDMSAAVIHLFPQTQSLPIMASETPDPTFPEAKSPSPELTGLY